MRSDSSIMSAISGATGPSAAQPPASTTQPQRRPGPARHSPATAAAWACLLVVWVVWGSTYVAIRVGVESIPPLAMAAIRYLIAGAVLFPIAKRGGGAELRVTDRPRLAQWLGMAVVGTMLLAFGNGAASYAEQTLPAGLTALLIATVPIWMVLADRVLNGQRIALVSWLALLLGAAGVAILARPHGHGALLPVLIVLGGSLSWGTGSVLAGRLPAPARPLLGSAMEMLAGGAVLTGLAAATGELSRIDPGQLVALDVVPDCPHGLLEGPCLTALPVQIVTPQIVAEYLPRAGLEQMPGSHQIQRRVSRSQTADVGRRLDGTGRCEGRESWLRIDHG